MFRMLFAVAVAALPTLASAQTPPPKPACTSPEHRQFDFWVGKWAVSQTGKERVVAESLIESVYNGCGVRENWMPKNNQTGGSLNIWLPGEKVWKQTWIDSSGARGLHRRLERQGHGAHRQVGRAAGAHDLHAERRRHGAPGRRTVHRRWQDLDAQLRLHLPQGEVTTSHPLLVIPVSPPGRAPARPPGAGSGEERDPCTSMMKVKRGGEAVLLSRRRVRGSRSLAAPRPG